MHSMLIIIFTLTMFMNLVIILYSLIIAHYLFYFTCSLSFSFPGIPYI
jgi:hypothetical protein